MKELNLEALQNVNGGYVPVDKPTGVNVGTYSSKSGEYAARALLFALLHSF